jgi:hypothetical protein
MAGPGNESTPDHLRGIRYTPTALRDQIEQIELPTELGDE